MRALYARIAQIVGAWGLLTILFVVFDDMLYPAAIFTWGPAFGGVIMTTCAIAINLVMLISYERAGTDWLGVNVLEDIKTKGEQQVERLDGWFDRHFDDSLLFAAFAPYILMAYYAPSRFFLAVLWALKKNDVLAFVALNIFQDPFVATVFLRHGRFDGLRKRDWLVFVGSVIFSNGYWIIRSTILVEILRYGWKNFVN